MADVARRAVEFGGKIDIWVSNVGTGAVGAFHDVPLDAHEQVIRSNLIGHMNDAHAVLPIFLRQGHGIFINMISLGGFAAAPFAAAYSASKFGLRGFSKALRGELLHHKHIHVCDVYPSFVDTPGIAHGANYTGRQLSAPPPILDARRVADAILRLARRPKPTTMIGAPTALLRLAHAMSPELTTRATAMFLESYFRRAPRTATSSGNLFRPASPAGGIDGGLRLPARRSAATTLALGLGALAVVAVALQGRK